jgi:hypothetical protein
LRAGLRDQAHADTIVFALRKSTVAPCHQDERGFDPQRSGQREPACDAIAHPGMAGVVGSRVQRSISIKSIRSLRSPRICDRATVGKPQRKF